MLYAGRVPCFTLPPSFSRMLAFELVPTLFLCLPFSMFPSFSDVCAVRARSLSRSPLPLVSWFLSSRSLVQYSGREWGRRWGRRWRRRRRRKRLRGEAEARGREAATLSRKPDGLTEHDSTVGWWATDGLFARSKPARPKESQEREKEREPRARWYGMEPRSVEMQRRRRQRRRRWWRRRRRQLPAIVSFLNTYMVDDVSYDRLMWFLGRWPDTQSTCRIYVIRISYGARILSRYPYRIRRKMKRDTLVESIHYHSDIMFLHPSVGYHNRRFE